MLGKAYGRAHEFELARDTLRQALTLDAGLHVAAIELGLCYSQLGQHVEAAEVFEGLLKRGVRSLEVLFAINQLPPSLVRIDVLDQLDKLVPDPDADKAEFDNATAFIRATALDKLGRHAEAWDILVPANRKVFQHKQEELAELAERRRRCIAQLRQNPIQAKGDSKGTISLFIVGASRAGKSTMEWLVSALDGVKRGYEHAIVQIAVRRAFQRAGLLTSSRFEILPPALEPACRELYLEELERRAGPAKVFTNTSPECVFDARRIAGVFPNVRFILVKRNLDDTLLRIYMRKYASGNAYAFDLNAIREHLTWYDELIDALARTFPDISRVIRYEDMVAEPSAARRLVADLCGLSVTDVPLTSIGDDRGCAEPYRQFIAAAAKH
jgi:tetratricopeptide (TPR) repeat protein